MRSCLKYIEEYSGDFLCLHSNYNKKSKKTLLAFKLLEITLFDNFYYINLKKVDIKTFFFEKKTPKVQFRCFTFSTVSDKKGKSFSKFVSHVWYIILLIEFLMKKHQFFMPKLKFPFMFWWWWKNRQKMYRKINLSEWFSQLFCLINIGEMKNLDSENNWKTLIIFNWRFLM